MSADLQQRLDALAHLAAVPFQDEIAIRAQDFAARARAGDPAVLVDVHAWLAQLVGAVVARVGLAMAPVRGRDRVLESARALWVLVAGDRELRGGARPAGRGGRAWRRARVGRDRRVGEAARRRDRARDLPGVLAAGSRK